MYKIAVIGSGNVAFTLSVAMKQRGLNLYKVYSRNRQEGEKLVKILNKSEINLYDSNITYYSSSLDDLMDCDAIILSVSDSSIEVVKREISQLRPNGDHPILIHTCGSAQMDILKSGNSEYGVLYPLMTLSKIKPVDFKIVPFLIEYSGEKAGAIIRSIVEKLGSEYKVCSSYERLRLHLAAVYVSNFVNYLISCSFDIAKPDHMFLMPLALETVRKAFLYENPDNVQTGPAKRGDLVTIDKHKELLKSFEGDHAKVYEQLTNLIFKKYNSK